MTRFILAFAAFTALTADAATSYSVTVKNSWNEAKKDEPVVIRLGTRKFSRPGLPGKAAAILYHASSTTLTATPILTNWSFSSTSLQARHSNIPSLSLAATRRWRHPISPHAPMPT